jgi:hypothetical protein
MTSAEGLLLNYDVVPGSHVFDKLGSFAQALEKCAFFLFDVTLARYTSLRNGVNDLPSDDAQRLRFDPTKGEIATPDIEAQYAHL